jgi:hypothetical protein
MVPLPSAQRRELKERLRAEYRAAPTRLRTRAEAAFAALAPSG